MLLGQVNALMDTATAYKNEAEVITNPREEAADIFEAIKNNLINTWAKDMLDQVKLIGILFNMISVMRRLENFSIIYRIYRSTKLIENRALDYFSFLLFSGRCT